MSNTEHASRQSHELPSLEDLLQATGRRDEIVMRALKRGLAQQLGRAMEEQKLSKTAMATRMGTSRAQLDRVLDPEAFNVTLETMARAAQSIGKRLQLELV